MASTTCPLVTVHCHNICVKFNPLQRNTEMKYNTEKFLKSKRKTTPIHEGISIQFKIIFEMTFATCSCELYKMLPQPFTFQAVLTGCCKYHLEKAKSVYTLLCNCSTHFIHLQHDTVMSSHWWQHIIKMFHSSIVPTTAYQYK